MYGGFVITSTKYYCVFNFSNNSYPRHCLIWRVVCIKITVYRFVPYTVWLWDSCSKPGRSDAPLLQLRRTQWTRGWVFEPCDEEKNLCLRARESPNSSLAYRFNPLKTKRICFI
jgi:hypothetical protein